jgi:hypothetical protein
MELANACSLQKAYLGFDRASISWCVWVLMSLSPEKIIY